VFKDPSCRYDGIIWFFEGEVKDGKGEIAGKKLIAIYDNLSAVTDTAQAGGKELDEVNPSILWDFIPQDSTEPININITKEKAQVYAIRAVENYKGELQKERKRQAKIKRKYGIKSLEYLISELDAELAGLYERQAEGERVDLPIRNKEERKRQYEEALKALEKEIEQETSLAISMPRFLGAVLVKPEISDMITNEEIEKIGMEIAIEYEKNQGRIPEDVSKENLGFDIRSKGKDETRYIEVKARKDEGPVALTPNEWFKAKRFKEQYWLYVVSNAVTKPALYLINNPAENLNIQEKVEVVRFLVSLEEWKGKGMKI